MSKLLNVLVLCGIVLASSGCVRTKVVYRDRYITVQDTTEQVSLLMLTELYDEWQIKYGQSIPLDSTVTPVWDDVCHFSREWSSEAYWFMKIRLSKIFGVQNESN